MSHDPQDCYEHGSISSCCGAPVMLGDMCSECHEHCDTEQEFEENCDGPDNTDPKCTPYSSTASLPPAPSSDVPLTRNLRCHRAGGSTLRDQLIAHQQPTHRRHMPTNTNADARAAMQLHVDNVNKAARDSYDYAVANHARNIEAARTNLAATIKNAVDLAGRTIASEQSRLSALGQPKVVTVADLFGTEVA